MLNLDMQTANSGLACSASGPCPSLAPSTHYCNSGTAPLEPLTSLEAITAILHLNDDDIFAYLNSARSPHQGRGSLSRNQCLAIWALRGYSDVEIETWLKEARQLCETEAYPLKL